METTSARVTGYAEGAVLTGLPQGRNGRFPCDSVILAVGYREEDTLPQAGV